MSAGFGAIAEATARMAARMKRDCEVKQKDVRVSIMGSRGQKHKQACETLALQAMIHTRHHGIPSPGLMAATFRFLKHRTILLEPSNTAYLHGGVCW